jgi:two-component system chemotaxis response regulator CheB
MRDVRGRLVVIGVSAGGMNALVRLFSALPRNFSVPMLVVQHVSADADDFLAGHLSRLGGPRVRMAEDKSPLDPGRIYLAPPNYHLLVDEDGTCALSVDERVNFARPSVDVLFESAADVYGERLVAIVLTGANDDGSSGLAAVAAAGGTAVVQDPQEAEMAAMPRAALARVPQALVLGLDDIATFLREIEEAE